MLGLVRVLWIVAQFALIAFAGWQILNDKQKAQLQNWVISWSLAGITGATSLIGQGEQFLQPIAAAFLNAFNTYGGPLADELRAPIAGFVQEELNTVTAGLVANGESTPDNAVGIASDAMADAFGFGVSSAAVTAAFEALFPEKLNVLNGAGPMIAKFAGFDEVAAAVRDPLYENAFGKSLDYHFRSIFKPDLPNEADAVTWHSRRLLTDAQLQTIFNYSGLKTEYEAPFVASAYRAVPPFLLARAAEAGAIPDAQLDSILQFDGYRDQDIAALKVGWAYLAVLPYITQYVTAAVRSTELGVMTPQELGDSLTQANLTQQQQAWIQLTVATRKLEQLAELYRKSISEGYAYGSITDAQYVPSLEAIGIGAADAQAHYAVDSIKKQGKALVAAQKAAARLAAQQLRAAGKAAIQGYRSGTLDAAALEAALLAAGYDPVVAGYAVAYETLKQEGAEAFVYGVTLPRAQAAVLHETVSAIAAQSRAQLLAPPQAESQLLALGIPQSIAGELVANWFASHITAADVGVKLPT